MVSMASATLGNFGLLAAWISYLFLLYTLLSAYISGGADVLNSLLFKLGIHLNEWQTSSLFTLLFGLVVYGGIYYVDYANRLLMFGKLTVYCLLVVLIAPHIEMPNLMHGDMRVVGSSIMILITSFGFAIIVPNLRDYFDDDINTLKKVILIGSLIPLLCYLAWDAVIIGSLHSETNQGLASLMHSAHTTSDLADLLAVKIQNPTVIALFNFFTSICMLTAFLGVSLCLYSFLADGLKLRDTGSTDIKLFTLTFLPPLLIVIYYPGAYLHALNYAGIFCIILLVLLPALMCYFGRKKYHSIFIVPGGKILQLVVIAVSLALLMHEIWGLWI
jgi:tyrosine-specific transport protein